MFSCTKPGYTHLLASWHTFGVAVLRTITGNIYLSLIGAVSPSVRLSVRPFVIPSQFVGRLLSNPSADCHKILCVGWVSQKIMRAKIPFPN